MKILIYVISLLSITLSTSFGTTNYYAVLVGINDYPGDYDLDYCINDITDVKDMLIQVGDWSTSNMWILTDNDATESNIQSRINTMKSYEDADDVCLFMFSGHGDNSPEGLIPYDMNNRITPSELESWFSGFSTNKIVVLLDACYSGLFDDELSKGVVLMACQYDETAEDSDNLQNGVFSFYVAEGMKGFADLSGSTISAEEIFSYADPLVNYYPTEYPQDPEDDDNYSGSLETIIKTFTLSGSLSHNEIWSGSSLTLSGNVTVPSGITLTILTGITVGSSKTLTLASGATVKLYVSYIKSTGGTITRQSGVSVYPDISVKSGSSLEGLYSSVWSAINNASSGQDVHLGAGSFYGFDMKTGVDVIGAGSASTTILLQVNFDDVTSTTLSNVTVKSKIVMNSGYDNMISNAIVEKTIELNYGRPQIISGVEADHYTSPDIDIYHGSAEVDGFTSTKIKDWGIYLHTVSDMDIWDSSIEGKDRAIYLEGNSSTSVDDIYFCHNDYDIYAGIQSSGGAGYGTVFSGNPAYTTYGDVDYPHDWEWCGFYKRVVSEDGMSAGVLNISTTPAESDDPGLIDYQKALEVYRAIKQKLRADFTAGKKPNRQQYASDYSNAMDLFKQVIDKYPGTLSSIKALGKVANCYWALNQPQSLSDYLNKIVDNSHYSVLKPHARNLLIPYHLHRKDYQEALQLSDEILADPPDENLSCDALYGKGIIYLYYVEDTTRALEAFQQVLAQYPDHPTALSAQAKLEDMGIEYVAPDFALTPVASEELTIQSYPNPFNPTATIRFGLPEASSLQLIVYDIMGREVIRLMDRYMEAGQQQVVWNGKTAGGREVPTGIYIARLITPAATRSIKLVLLK